LHLAIDLPRGSGDVGFTIMRIEITFAKCNAFAKRMIRAPTDGERTLANRNFR
jgi:hypothetical protein